MTTPNQNQPICRNGHKQPNATSRFCIYCGTSLTNQAANQPIQPAQPQPVQQPPVAVPPPTANQNVQNYQNKPVQPPHPNPVQPPQVVPTPPIKSNNPPPIQQNQGIQPPVYQQQVYRQEIYQQQIYQQQVFQQPIPVCQTCGGEGKNLEEKQLVCQDCQWLRPLAPGYGIEPGAFQWAEDGKAMSVLRSITPLTMAAQVISDKVGRRWIETTFNGVLLSEKQLPEVYFQAVKAARILGMSYMPDIYVSGELLWDCRTYGSDKDSFIVMGSALATNFRGPELLFLFAREMGHCRTGHALWKTVIKFLLGEQGPRGGVMSQGLFAAVGKVLSPTALIEGTIEVPLLAWARQAEITADRAGLLAVGNEEIVRKVLLSWSLKSPLLQRQINVEEWLKQQAVNDDEMLKLSELMTSATPYVTRRLNLIAQFAQSPELNRWQAIIKQYVEKAEAKPQPNNNNKPIDKDVIRMKCSTCGTPMRIPSKVFEGKTQMSIRCPDAKCGKITYMKKKTNPSPKGSDLSKKERKELERNLNYGE